MEFRSTTFGQDPASISAYAALWEKSTDRCPFQAPGILAYYGSNTPADVRLFALHRDDRMVCAVVLKQDGLKNLTFLSDLKTDVNRFVFHVEADQAARKYFFERLMGTIYSEGLSFTLNSQAGDDEATALVTSCAAEAGLYNSVLPNSGCPVLVASDPAALFAHVNGLRELRYRVNKLRNQQGAVFEVFTDHAELDEWADAFCATHLRRWADTPTPSNFRKDHRRAFFKGCLRVWADAGLLVRFSVRVGLERIGFVVGLRAPNSIIHHSTTYDPRFAKNSPGKALILHMAEWMADNRCSTLDFGDGREDYKYSVANGERPLVRVFIARKDDLRFILSTSVIRVVRGNTFMYDVYQRHIKRSLQARSAT